MGLPLYLPGNKIPRVVIIGGGYSGLAAVVTLREYCPAAQISLIDPQADHLKITHLHESFRRPLRELHVPFCSLERRFNFRHIRANISFDEPLLEEWNHSRTLSVDGEIVDFDYVLLACGAAARALEKSDHVLDLEDFARESGPDLLSREFKVETGSENVITVVGGGATGIQFLFEIAHYLKLPSDTHQLRLVDGDTTPLRQFNPKLGRYVEAKMADLGIGYLPGHLYRHQSSNAVVVEKRDTSETYELPSNLTLLFLGKQPLARFDTNWFGQVIVKQTSLENIFAAGDCSRFRLPGSNAFSAQSAVRKGKLAARNILRHSGAIKILEPYLHQDFGYVISLGPTDAIGWVGLKGNVIGGQPAMLAKEVVEAQYDLLLAGVDTYLI